MDSRCSDIANCLSYLYFDGKFFFVNFIIQVFDLIENIYMKLCIYWLHYALASTFILSDFL